MSSRLLSALAIAAAACWLFVMAAYATDRPGFSPDEELTALVVVASPVAGVPILPSGVLYLRGLAYLKFVSLAGTIKQSLPTYRRVSLLFGVVNVLLIAVLSSTNLTPAAGPVAAILLAAAPLHSTMSAFARPYTAAVTCLLLALLAAPRSKTIGGATSFVVLAIVAQLVHEVAVLLAFVPLAYALTMDDDDRQRRRVIVLSLLTGFIGVGIQVGLSMASSASMTSLLGTADGPSAVVVLRSVAWPPLYVPGLARPVTFLVAAILMMTLAWWLRRAIRLSWPELVIGAAMAALFLLGPLLVLSVLAIVTRPTHGLKYAGAAAALGALSAVGWTVHTSSVTDAALSWRLCVELARASLAYPLDWLWTIVSRFPLATACAVIANWLPVSRSARHVRIVGAVLWLMIVTFGLFRVADHDRYLTLLLPHLLVLASFAVVEMASAVRRQADRYVRTPIASATAATVMCIVAGMLLVEQRVYAQRPDAEMDSHSTKFGVAVYEPRTYLKDAAFQKCIDAIPRTDAVVCNDELACGYVLNRIDGWLLPDPRLRAVCAATRDGVSRGIYLKSRILTDEGSLAAFVAARPNVATTVLIVATPKFGVGEQEAIVRRLAEMRQVAPRTCGAGGVMYRFEARVATGQ